MVSAGTGEWLEKRKLLGFSTRLCPGPAVQCTAVSSGLRWSSSRKLSGLEFGVPNCSGSLAFCPSLDSPRVSCLAGVAEQDPRLDCRHGP